MRYLLAFLLFALSRGCTVVDFAGSDSEQRSDLNENGIPDENEGCAHPAVYYAYHGHSYMPSEVCSIPTDDILLTSAENNAYELFLKNWLAAHENFASPTTNLCGLYALDYFLHASVVECYEMKLKTVDTHCNGDISDYHAPLLQCAELLAEFNEGLLNRQACPGDDELDLGSESAEYILELELREGVAPLNDSTVRQTLVTNPSTGNEFVTILIIIVVVSLSLIGSALMEVEFY